MEIHGSDRSGEFHVLIDLRSEVLGRFEELSNHLGHDGAMSKTLIEVEVRTMNRNMVSVKIVLEYAPKGGVGQ